MVAVKILSAFAAAVKRRDPDFVIGGQADPYLLRWWVIPRNNWFNIYLHEIRRSDDDRALHDHMYLNLSILIEGEYIEHTIAQGGVHHQRHFKAGDWTWRLPSKAHRLQVLGKRTTTLFITGPRVRQWGFHCPQGWVHWKKFVDERDSGEVGKGCEP